MRNRAGKSTTGLDRANQPAILILTSLASGAKHGYLLAQDIEGFARVTLGLGTLYGAIARLEERGLIEAVDGDARRRPYRITAAGRVALVAAVQQMWTIADEGAARLGLTPVARRRVAPAQVMDLGWTR